MRHGVRGRRRFTVDATGWWKVRLTGAEGTQGEYEVALKYGAPSLPALPEVVRSRRVSGTIDSAVDVHEIPFTGGVGQSLRFALTVPRGSSLDPRVTLVRPDGTEAALAGAGSRETRLAIARTLDQAGVWRIEVSGRDTSPAPESTEFTTGASTASLRLGRAVAVTLVPDGNGQFRIPFPAVGGAVIGWSLTADGPLPTFNALLDASGRAVTFPGAGPSAPALTLPSDLLLGDFTLVFDAAPDATPRNVRLVRTIALPHVAAARRVTMSPLEPLLLTTADALGPAGGGAGTTIRVRTYRLTDEDAPLGAPALFVGHTPLADVRELTPSGTFEGRLDADLPLGTYDVVVTSTSGQPAARAAAFRVLPRPVVESSDAPLAPTAGGAVVTIRGKHFTESMGILFDGELQPLTPTAVTATSVTFVTPPHEEGTVLLGVHDRVSGRDAAGQGVTLQFFGQPFIQRVFPPLVTALGGDEVRLEGFLFSAADKVFLETATPGTFEEITATTSTWVNPSQHRFTAPPRPPGAYLVYVEDDEGRPDPRQTKTLTYFTYAGTGASAGVLDGGVFGESVTSALADVDGDGDLDLVLARRGGAAASSTSLLRVLRNDGHGAFTDATAAVLPPAGADDWRADRVVAADMDGDGTTDLVLTTNSETVPPADRSHTRILLNEARGGSGAGANDRVLRDRTAELMAPVRTMRRYGFDAASSTTYVSDSWRGLDVFVGDVDRSGAGPPEIVITHDETKADDNPQAGGTKSGVFCGSYCGVATGFQYAYTFYWGGTRQFVWDKSARGGLGRYRFDANRFPRRSGPVVPILAPGGITIGCNSSYNMACKDTFTPFRGERVAVGDLNGDGKPDVAVVSPQVVQRRAKINDPLVTISSLQVAFHGFNPYEGVGLTDVTSRFTALGLDLRGRAVAIGATGYPDGNAFGTVAVGLTTPVSGRALRLFRFTATGTASPVTDVSDLTLQPAETGETEAPSELAFADVDADGDADLVVLAPSAGGGPFALRVLRSGKVGSTFGVFNRSLDGLIAPAAAAAEDAFEGDALAIGDVSGDGDLDFVVSRPATGGAQGTRIVVLDH